MSQTAHTESCRRRSTCAGCAYHLLPVRGPDNHDYSIPMQYRPGFSPYTQFPYTKEEHDDAIRKENERAKSTPHQLTSRKTPAGGAAAYFQKVNAPGMNHTRAVQHGNRNGVYTGGYTQLDIWRRSEKAEPSPPPDEPDWKKDLREKSKALAEAKESKAEAKSREAKAAKAAKAAEKAREAKASKAKADKAKAKAEAKAKAK